MRFMERWRARVSAYLAAAAGVLVVSAIAAPAAAQSVKWQTIIGIIQAGNVVGTGTNNPITGGGQPWSTLGGRARVDLSGGRAEFEVRGLVLAGGNTIGTPGAITQVKGTLVCITGTVLQAFDTALVPLDARGDAEFSGPIGPIPTTCTPTNTSFLVRIVSQPSDRWIANGAVRTSSGM